MIQNAIVKSITGEKVAQVSLLRQVECGLSCNGNCEGCGMKPKGELLAMASNEIGAQPGDLVEVETTTGNSIGIAAIVYLLPCITLGAGYVVGQAVFLLGEVAALGTAAVGLVLGFLPAYFLNRSITRRKQPEFAIRRRLA